MADPAKYWSNNLGGTISLLEAMREIGVRTIVFSSTAAVYGEPERTPILETDPTRPTSPYGESKIAVDTTLTEYCRLYGFGAVSLRYFNVAGAHEGAEGRWLGERHNPETHLIPNVLAAATEGRPVQIFGDDYPTPDGTCIRDYIHVTDLADAHLRALGAARPGEHRIYNLGNGAGFSVREVIEVCREVTGIDIAADVGPRRAGDPAVLVASSAKIQSELGWRAIARPERPWPPTPGGSPRRARPGEGGFAVPGAVRRGAGRRVAGPGAGQPDGRAHRLQRGVRAAVRARPGGHRRGGAEP